MFRGATSPQYTAGKLAGMIRVVKQGLLSRIENLTSHAVPLVAFGFRAKSAVIINVLGMGIA